MEDEFANQVICRKVGKHFCKGPDINILGLCRLYHLWQLVNLIITAQKQSLMAHKLM
jgi:hypothetical protein